MNPARIVSPVKAGMSMARSAAVAAVLLLLAAPVHSQTLVLRANRLLNAGRVFAAESLYYDAVQRDPRNPDTRLALGKYLAARGALRVGAVLMEEARYFGGDPALVARDLAPVYEQLGDWASLAVLPASPLSPAERRRAEWLRDHPPAILGPDSGTVTYRVTDTDLLGQVELRIGPNTVRATIDGRAHGLMLDVSFARDRAVRLFGAPAAHPAADTLAAVARSVHLGGYTLTNVPVTLAAQRSPERATIGLDLLARLAPTFNPTKGRIMLRKSGRIDTVRGFPIPTFTTTEGVFVVKTMTTFPLRHPDVQQYLRRVPWTLDEKRGELLVAGSW